jgi:hypothetical protein
LLNAAYDACLKPEELKLRNRLSDPRPAPGHPEGIHAPLKASLQATQKLARAGQILASGQCGFPISRVCRKSLASVLPPSSPIPIDFLSRLRGGGRRPPDPAPQWQLAAKIALLSSSKMAPGASPAPRGPRRRAIGSRPARREAGGKPWPPLHTCASAFAMARRIEVAMALISTVQSHVFEGGPGKRHCL